MKIILIAIAVALLATTACGWTPGIWPLAGHPTVNIYTNPVGNDLLTNVVLRSRWLGDANWCETNIVRVIAGYTNNVVSVAYGTNLVVITNVYPVLTNIVVTNLYGRFCLPPYTGAVEVTAASLERLTRQIEAVLPYYSLTNYTRGTNWCFDEWFFYTASNDFPVATKLDLFFHNTNTPLGGIVGLATTDLWTNGAIQAMATGGDAYWIKRLNRLNQLVVARWNSAISWPGWGKNWPRQYWPYATPPAWDTGDPSYVNEFSDDPSASTASGWGRSRLIDCTNRPVFIVTPLTTNGYTPGSLTLTFAGGDDPAYGTLYDPSSNTLVNGSSPSQVISTTTTRADTAWLKLSAPFEDNLPSNQKPVAVTLLWDQPMTTYEGTRVWDNVLLPEQLDAHHIALTNMFLVPWSEWNWTNSLLGYSTYYTHRSNEWVVLPLPTNRVVTNETDYWYCDITTNADLLLTGPYWGEETFDWWLYGDPCEWEHTLNVYPITNLWQWVTASLTNPVQPYFDIKARSIFWFEQYLDQELTCVAEEGYNRPDHVSSSAGRHDEVVIDIHGSNVTSQIAATGMFTGSLHRAHFYVRGDYTTTSPPVTNQLWHRIEVSQWTYDPIIVSTSRVGCMDNFVLDNPTSICSRIDKRVEDNCCDDVPGYVLLPDYVVDITAEPPTTNDYHVVTNNYWVNTCDSNYWDGPHADCSDPEWVQADWCGDGIPPYLFHNDWMTLGWGLMTNEIVEHQTSEQIITDTGTNVLIVSGAGDAWLDGVYVWGTNSYGEAAYVSGGTNDIIWTYMEDKWGMGDNVGGGFRYTNSACNVITNGWDVSPLGTWPAPSVMFGGATTSVVIHYTYTVADPHNNPYVVDSGPWTNAPIINEYIHQSGTVDRVYTKDAKILIEWAD